MQGVVNSPVFWSFVQGTMPTMGNGRHVLRRGPLVQFFVVLSKHSIQSEIAGRVRQLMETESAEEAWFSRRIPSTFSPKGSFLKKNRGDKTAIELFLAGIQGLDAMTRAMLGH